MVFVEREDDGGDWYALRFEYKMTPPVDLITTLETSLQKKLTHNFEAKWQDQFKTCMENLSPHAIVFDFDFAKRLFFQMTK